LKKRKKAKTSHPTSAASKASNEPGKLDTVADPKSADMIPPAGALSEVAVKPIPAPSAIVENVGA
jgi:hypothetical protein